MPADLAGSQPVSVAGLLLAAGAGRRMGGPKVLSRHADGEPFVQRGLRSLVEGGCGLVVVVLGAAAEEARALVAEVAAAGLGRRVDTVEAPDWDEGMGASLRAGLRAVEPHHPEAVLVTLVDLPDVDAAVVRRLLATGGGSTGLARAAYLGRPGHPVLIGADHLAGVAESARGDQGARDYLATHDHALVECGDLATGEDLDHPSDLSR